MGWSSNNNFMSSTESMATPAFPTSPTTRSWSLSYPRWVGKSKATDNPFCAQLLNFAYRKHYYPQRSKIQRTVELSMGVVHTSYCEALLKTAPFLLQNLSASKDALYLFPEYFDCIAIVSAVSKSVYYL